ncbi:MAG: tetratricopeptide repeat protein, partial [Candidatus Kariarchaeaceae archaeon]
MVLDEATHFLLRGEYERGIDFIDETLIELTDEHLVPELLLIKSRMYYHIGRVDQASYFALQVTEMDSSNEIAAVLLLLYDFEQGYHLPVREKLVELKDWEVGETTPDRIPQLSWYFYTHGLIADYDGDLENAVEYFSTSLELREQLDDQFEMNIIYYRLATVERKLGNLDEAQRLLKKSLELSSNLGLVTETATNSTLIGQDLLMRGDYDEAIPYLLEGIEAWKLQGSPFGTIWALGELAIVNYLAGNYTKAIGSYEQIIPIAEEIMPPIYLSHHYTNLFRFYLEAGSRESAKEILVKTEGLVQDDIIALRLRLMKALLMLDSDRLVDKLSQKTELEELQTAEDLEIRLRSLIAGIELLVTEYRVTSHSLYKEEILEESEEKLEQFLSSIRLQSGITSELHAAVLRSRIDLLRYNPKKAYELLEQVRNGEIRPLEIQKRLDELEQDIENLEWSRQAFQFEKEFHSVPTLKIMMYLLPRELVTFSELQRG